MTNIIITKEYKYLGEYPLFKENGLPVGYLIDKGKVGCGGTSIALEAGLVKRSDKKLYFKFIHPSLCIL